MYQRVLFISSSPFLQAGVLSPVFERATNWIASKEWPEREVGGGGHHTPHTIAKGTLNGYSMPSQVCRQMYMAVRLARPNSHICAIIVYSVCELYFCVFEQNRACIGHYL